MDAAGVHGKEATPFLLGRIVELTGGASLEANIALVNNNARLGAEVVDLGHGRRGRDLVHHELERRAGN